jgi:hypothetical protein
VNSEGTILWGLVFGSIGLGYFVYGKRQRRGVPLACGLGLMIFPYLVSNTILLVLIGLVLGVCRTFSVSDWFY